MLQAGGFDPYLTVREMLEMYAGYYPAPRSVDEVHRPRRSAARRRPAVCARCPAASSAGSISALGLVGDPDLLVPRRADDRVRPVGARARRGSVIRRLGALGKTVLLTTHYMEEAQALADRVVVIAAGEKVADGSPESIGGRATAEVAIRFDLPAGVGVADLPVAATEEAGAGRGRCAPRTRLRSCATSRSGRSARGEELDGLTVARPSLEDVYLRAHGRDDAAEHRA